MTDGEANRIESLEAEIAGQRRRIEELEQAARELEAAKLAQADALKALRREQEFSRVLLEHLSDGVVACDADANLVLFNQASRNWHGVDVRRLPPHEWSSHYDLFGPDGTTPLKTEEIPLLRAYRGEQVRGAEMTIVAKGQPPRHILADGGPLFDLNGEKVGAVVAMHDVTEQRRAEEEARRHSITKEQLIRAQAEALTQLSTPMIPISDEVVVMPLIGTVDVARAEAVLETLLSGITERRARVAIIDITGVSVVNTEVANGLLRAAMAAQLLGAQVVLTGIRPVVAQTLVSMGIDLQGIVTRSTLQRGIAFAMGSHG